ncbi:MAG: NAD(P)/FAD-dependent oxidoreductase [Pseudomonadota bacterium]
MSIEIDKDSGLKVFNTRSRLARDRTSSGGLRVNNDSGSKVLPDAPQGAVFSATEQAKYLKEMESRAGHAEYVDLEGSFAHYLEDLDSGEVVEREALHDECEVLVVGAGFSALMLGYKLQQHGFQDVRFCEKGGDVGGTWYWNRYPGVACDVESYSYLPLLDEVGSIPSMKFASGFEIMEHAQKIAELSGFYKKALFHTTVVESTWNESLRRWTVRTDRGDEMKAKFLVLANGILSTPRLAKIKGQEDFKGEAFHTARWRYDVDLTGKRVGVVGTGATGIQVIPEIARVAGELTVFQRTPSTVDVRDQRETTDEERQAWKVDSDWARKRRARFANIQDGRAAMKAGDDYLSGKVDHYKELKVHNTKLSSEERLQKQQDTNFKIMESIRARVDALVDDPETAEALKPYYQFGCKRPGFHDEYLPTFNLPHVSLVNTAPTGIERVNESGVVHKGKQYDLDVLIYATGYEFMATSTFNMVTGRNGQTLLDKWAEEGTKTYLGVHSQGFPNLFIVMGPQSGGYGFNLMDGIHAQTDHILWVLQTMRDRGSDIVDVHKEYEEQYVQHCADMDIATKPLRDCLSYYDGYGKAKPGSLGYYGGAEKWIELKNAAEQSPDAFIFENSD